jgi:hypothetical protein
VTVVAVLSSLCGDDRLEPALEPSPCPAAVFHLEPCALAHSRTAARVSPLTGAVGRASASPQVAMSVGALVVPEMAPRRDLTLTTSGQGDQGRGRRHVPGLRPPDHSVHSRRCVSRCAGSIQAQASSLTLRSPSAAVTQAISYPTLIKLVRAALFI